MYFHNGEPGDMIQVSNMVVVEIERNYKTYSRYHFINLESAENFAKEAKDSIAEPPCDITRIELWTTEIDVSGILSTGTYIKTVFDASPLWLVISHEGCTHYTGHTPIDYIRIESVEDGLKQAENCHPYVGNPIKIIKKRGGEYPTNCCMEHEKVMTVHRF